MVWSDQIPAATELLNRTVRALDLFTGIDYILGPGIRPAIWGNTAVWLDLSGPQKAIRSHDFSTGQSTLLAVVDGGDDVLGISGQWVVWTGKDPTQQDTDALHLLNMFTGEHSLIGNPNNQRSPAIWGGRIVWTEVRRGTQDVFAYDLGTRKETRVTNDAVAELSPDIFGDVVAWHDNRFGSSFGEVLTVFAVDLRGRLAQPRPLGYLESVDAQGIARGWAVSPAAPATTVHLAFYDGPRGTGRLLGEATADRPRADVNRITAYPGNHGFEFTLPASYHDGQDHSLFVYILEDSPGIFDGLLLDGCPMVFRLDPS
jgi:beta propeller repeat protein